MQTNSILSREGGLMSPARARLSCKASSRTGSPLRSPARRGPAAGQPESPKAPAFQGSVVANVTISSG